MRLTLERINMLRIYAEIAREMYYRDDVPQDDCIEFVIFFLEDVIKRFEYNSVASEEIRWSK